MTGTRGAADAELRRDVARYFLVDEEVKQDPLAVWHRLRETDPVHWCDLGFWVLTRYADALAVLRDDRWSREPRNAGGYEHLSTEFSPGPARSMIAEMMLFKDPPDHTRLRSLVNRTFTPRAVAVLEGFVEKATATLLDAMAAGPGDEVDFKRDFSRPLPQLMLAHLLGVPKEDQDMLYAWSKDFLAIFRPKVTAEQEEASNAAVTAFGAYVVDLVEARRRAPTADLLSMLVAAEEAGDRLTEDELVSTCVLLIAAGLDTTTHLVENATLLLLENPDQLALLRADPGLWTGAVEEALRYDTPAPNALARWATADLEVAGTPVRKGEKCIVVLSAANHDPAQFEEPERFDVARQDNRHVAFGFGAHHCLGASLARLEARVALRRLFERFPGLRRTSGVRWAAVYGGRELVEFRVTLA